MSRLKREVIILNAKLSPWVSNIYFCIKVKFYESQQTCNLYKSVISINKEEDKRTQVNLPSRELTKTFFIS